MRSIKHCSASQGVKGFTITDLMVVSATIAVLLLLILPAMARTRGNPPAGICLNNLRQMSSAWTMYSADNSGNFVWSYPDYGSFHSPYAWCRGDADTTSSTYGYLGSDPKGLNTGKLWPYIKNISTYKCGADQRTQTIGSVTKPILRSYSMNSYLAGASYGDPSGVDFNVANGGNQTGVYRVYMKDVELRYPSKTFVLIDEDAISIADCMFLTDVGGSRPFIDIPGRRHEGGYGINFADGHAEIIKMQTKEALTLNHQGSPYVSPTNSDYQALLKMTTFPQK